MARIKLICVECGGGFTTQEALADQVVSNDEGFHHRECVGEGPTSPVSAEELVVEERAGELGPIDLEAENERRRDHGDPPLPPMDQRGDSSGCIPDPPPDDYEPGDRRIHEMEAEEDRGRYDIEGR